MALKLWVEHPVSIETPKRNHFGKMVWTAANMGAAVVDGAGGGGLATSFVATLHHAFGDSSLLKQEEWQANVSELLNSMNKRLANVEGGFELTNLAQLIAIYCVQEIQPNLTHPIDRSKLLVDFSSEASGKIDESVFELNDFRLVRLSHAQGVPYLHLQIEQHLFLYLDPIVHGWIPQADAVALFRLMIENSSLKHIAILEEKLQLMEAWPRRRMNSALLYLKWDIFDSAHYRGAMSNDYPTIGFDPQAQECSRINRLSTKLERAGIEIPSL